MWVHLGLNKRTEALLPRMQYSLQDTTLLIVDIKLGPIRNVKSLYEADGPTD